MADPSLRISFGVEPSSVDSDDFLIIEQRDWDPYAGKITKSILANALGNMLYFEEAGEAVNNDGSSQAINYDPTESFDNSSIGPSVGDSVAGMSGSYSTNISCSMTGDGYLEAEIYVYPSRRDLEFNMHTTHGNLGRASSGLLDFQELILFKLGDSGNLSYPVIDINSAAWVGDTYDHEGGIINPPDVIYDGDKMVTESGVSLYGSLLVNYSVYRRVYGLRIGASDDIENQWDAVVYGVFAGGVDWLEVRADDNSSLDSSMCRGGGGVRFVDDDDDDGGEDESDSNRYTKIDYCTQTPNSDSFT